MTAPIATTQSRAEATRAKLQAATVESLAECGYSGTSTQEVCRRAGVSRGTMLHHYPNRTALLLAALDSILGDRVAHFVSARQGKARMTPRALVQELWAEWQGPVYAAWLELAVAARTEPELRDPMRETMARFESEIRFAFDELVDTGPLPSPIAETLPFLVFAIFNGLAVGASYEQPGHSDPVIEAVEMLAGLLPTTAKGSPR